MIETLLKFFLKFVGLLQPKPMHGFSPYIGINIILDLQLISFWRKTGNSCCHGNVLVLCSLKLLNLKKGTIEPILLQLHFDPTKGWGWEIMKRLTCGDACVCHIYITSISHYL